MLKLVRMLVKKILKEQCEINGHQWKYKFDYLAGDTRKCKICGKKEY